jgi:hypothetical protein
MPIRSQRGLPFQHALHARLGACIASATGLFQNSVVTLPFACATATQVLLLYRRILKAARLFPSIKRDAIIADIRLQFREHKAS